MAKMLDIPSYAALPIEPKIAQLCDQGAIEEFSHSYLDDMIRYIETIR